MYNYIDAVKFSVKLCKAEGIEIPAALIDLALGKNLTMTMGVGGNATVAAGEGGEVKGDAVGREGRGGMGGMGWVVAGGILGSLIALGW